MTKEQHRQNLIALQQASILLPSLKEWLGKIKLDGISVTQAKELHRNSIKARIASRVALIELDELIDALEIYKDGKAMSEIKRFVGKSKK